MDKEIIVITGGDGKIARAIVKKYLNNGSHVIAIVNPVISFISFSFDIFLLLFSDKQKRIFRKRKLWILSSRYNKCRRNLKVKRKNRK